MFIPCSTCKVQGKCRDEEVSCREAIFAVAMGEAFKCDDYQPDFYQGIEGVYNAPSVDGFCVRDDHRRRHCSDSYVDSVRVRFAR